MDQKTHLSANWSQITLIAFRFFFVYFVFYVFPFPLNNLPFSGIILEPLSQFSSNIVEGFGNIWGISLSIVNKGSSDSAFFYVKFFLFLFYSAVITSAWSILDRKRFNYDVLLHGFTIVLRYYLAIVMLNYGFAKVFQTQFAFPSTERLIQTFGESSPMGLLWTFMGYSKAYNIFTGLTEVIGGLFLFFKRTRLLGGIIITIAMSHVVMLNLSYDVPVKLYSLHLLAIAIILIVPDGKRLLWFLFYDKSTELHSVKLDLHSRKWWLYFVGKTLVLFILTTGVILHMRNQVADKNHLAKKNVTEPIYGEFEVQTFSINQILIPPDVNNPARWKRVLISPRNIDVVYMDGASIPWLFHGNTRKMVLLSPDLSTQGNFHVTLKGDWLTIHGKLNEDSLKIQLKKKSEASFPLVSREFHWISEEPFFR
jgi:hypothetical protein